MKLCKLITLLLICIIFSGSLCANASVYLEDFTEKNRYFTLSDSAVPADISDGKFVFDYSDVAKDSDEDFNGGRYITHRYIKAKSNLYVEFDFEVSDIQKSQIRFELRNYDGDREDSGIDGSILPFCLDYGNIIHNNGSVIEEYKDTKGTVTINVVADGDDTVTVTTYLNGAELYTTERPFRLFAKYENSEFQYNIYTKAKVPTGEKGPLISIDNIKNVIDEPIPSLYIGDAQMMFDFGDNRFLASENTFPYYKAKSVRQIANFSKTDQKLTNILAHYGEKFDLKTEDVTLSPGEVKYVTLANEVSDVQNGRVSAYLWNNLDTLTPLSKAYDVFPSLITVQTPDVLAKRLEKAANIHPRLLISCAEISKAQQYRSENTVYDYIQNALLSWETTHNQGDYLTASIPGYGKNNDNVGDMIAKRALVWGYLYQITGDEDYAKMLTDDMISIAKYQDWYHGESFLLTANIASALSIGYDFIYDYLSKDENKQNAKLITDAIYEKGIQKALDVFRKDSPGGWHRRVTNWNMICNSGIGVACMAIGGIDEYRQDSAIALNYVLRYLRYPIEYYPAEGGCVEGPGYLSYMVAHFSNFSSALFNTFGEDFGYCNYEVLRNIAFDPVKLSGSLYAFAYSDSNTTVTNKRPFFAFFGKYFGIQELGYFRYKQIENVINKIEENGQDMSEIEGEYDIMDIIWYDSSFMQTPANAGKAGYDEIYGIKTDTYYKDAGMVAFHDDYSPNQAFVAADFGKNKETHTHIDMGNFIYESNGEQWFSELGLVPYDYTDCSNPQYYRAKPEGHNCVVINPDSTYGQVWEAEGFAETVQLGEDASYAVMNISSAYTDNATSFKRLVYFDKITKGLAVKDKFSLIGDDNEYYWFAHTGAKITLSEEKREAILEKNGKKLKVALLSDGEFSIMEAERLNSLPTGLDERGDPENSGISKLVVHRTNMSGNCEITVVMTPVDSDGNAAFPDISGVDF